MVRRSSVMVLVGLVCLILGVTTSVAQVEGRTFPLKADGSVSVENSAGNTVIHAWSEGDGRNNQLKLLKQAFDDGFLTVWEYKNWFSQGTLKSSGMGAAPLDSAPSSVTYPLKILPLW